MFLFKKILGFIIIFSCIASYASVKKAEKIFYKNKGKSKIYHNVADELVKGGFYYSAIPFIKEYLFYMQTRKKDSFLADKVLEKIISNVGVKQFEYMPMKAMLRARGQTARFVIAKKYFKNQKYKKVISTIKRIKRSSSIYPFAVFVKASAESLLGRQKSAIKSYKECVKVSKKEMGRTRDEIFIKQLKINHDYCVIGIARSYFANDLYNIAEKKYQELPKESYIWPQIIFEEAWNSFYLKKYNRSLGKLVTYSSGFFDFYFNPEIEILKALTYMEMCLWDDAKYIVERFYKKYDSESIILRRYIIENGRNYSHYFKIGRSISSGKIKVSSILDKIVKTLTLDGTYLEMNRSLDGAYKELNRLRNMKRNWFRKILISNVVREIKLKKNIMGSYVRKNLVIRHNQIKNSLAHMSYIKLEVLSRKKNWLYNYNGKSDRKRGDIKYLLRHEKQYLWSFNGEFWADELGDYVFSLKPECK